MSDLANAFATGLGIGVGLALALFAIGLLVALGDAIDGVSDIFPRRKR